MENAARAVASEAAWMLGDVGGGTVLILCGGGNNGGDGLAAARHLHNQQIDVVVMMACDPARLKGDAKLNWDILRTMPVKVTTGSVDLERIAGGGWALVIDALFGTGLTDRPREPFGQIVDAVERAGAPVLSVDVPSGLDCDTGEPLGPVVRAACTVTFVDAKVGFANPAARDYVGRVVVGDIGCPRELIDEVTR